MGSSFMAAAVILLSFLFMGFIAYTMVVQRTVRVLDLFRSEQAGENAETRTQQLILLHIYLMKLNSAFVLGIVVYFITSRASTWYYGVTLVLLCGIGSMLIASSRWLRPGSTEMIALLVAEVKRQREWCRISCNAARLQAAETLLLRLQSITR